MNILILTKYPVRGPSSRYRFYQYLPAMHAAGHRVTIRPFFSDAYLTALFSQKGVGPAYLAARCASRLAHCLDGRRYDLAWIEGELIPFFPAAFERLLHILLPARIYEFDDANWLRYQGRRLLANKFQKILASAAGIVVGNNDLASYVSKFNSNVVVIPTVVDWTKYEGAKPSMKNHTLGWIGSQSTVFYLDQLRPVLRELNAKRPFRIKVIGANLTDPDLNIVNVPWSADSEVAMIESFDVGIMPLVDDAWSRGKCGLKLIQYLAAGVPCVASAVGVNREYLDQSGGGIAVESDADWSTALTQLLEDQHLRQEMGQRGRNWVEQEMTVQARAAQLIQFLEGSMP